MKLGQSALTPDERRTEAKKILDRLEDVFHEMQDHEGKFVTDMIARFDTYGDKVEVSPNQLFWLRDLNVKY